MTTTDEQKDFGRRVAFLRKRLGYSQAELAKKIDRSETWMSQVERGVRRLDRMSVLESLAAALDVPLDELAPDQPLLATRSESVAPASALALTLASNSALRALVESPEVADISDVEERTERVWEYTHASRYAEVADLLVELVEDVEPLVRQASGSDHERALVVKNRIYLAASGALSKLGESGAAWVAIDRAAMAGEELGRPLLLAESAFRLAITFQGGRRYDLALQIASTAAATIEALSAPDDADPAAVAVFGALHLQLAVASARLGRADDAYRHLNTARSAADRVEDGRNDFNMEFGAANVNLHEVAVAVALGDAGRALRVAEHAERDGLSAERRARLLIDVAAANAQLRRTRAVVGALTAAAEIAPEQIASHGRARELVSDLLREQSHDEEVRALAELVRGTG